MDESTNNLKFVIDESRQKHYLEKQIGQGGQGAVWKTTDPNIIVKMKVDPSSGEPIIDETIYEKYKADLDEVRVLDWPEGIHIAKVVSLLQKPYCGYTMRMLGDMKSIKYWIRPFDEKMNPIVFYVKTGGLRHRLALLTKVAEIFAKLNYHSIVYADLSPDNLFVSGDIKSSEVWLIDADNMRYYFDMKRQIMTPGYGAPEVEAGHVNTLESDEYSFAILAHEILTLNSPFAGERMEATGDGWDDDGDESESVEATDNEQNSYIPWIEDPNDDSNRCHTGIPGDVVFTEGIRKLFERTFSYEGQTNPASRPTMKEWFVELRHAQDLVIKCKHCTSTFFMRNTDSQCPFCRKEGRASVIYSWMKDEYDLDSIIDVENKSIDTFNKDGEFNVSTISKDDFVSETTVGTRLFDTFDGSYYLYNYHTDEIPFTDETEPTIEIQVENGKYTLINHTINEIKMSSVKSDYGVIPAGGSKRFEDISGLILTLPVLYGKREFSDNDTHMIDDVSIIRKRHIKFYQI